MLKKTTKKTTIGKRSRANLDAIREEVFERDGHRCVVALSSWELMYPCYGGLTLQHSVPRGMGGSAKYDGIDYLRTMCALHNGLETSHPEFAQDCQRNGWSVRRWVADQFGIRSIPVLYPDGWHLLQNGVRVPISRSTAQAILSDLQLTFDDSEDH